MDPQNTYLDEVVQGQQKVDRELKRGRGQGTLQPAAAAMPMAATQQMATPAYMPPEPVALDNYRITGFWIWKTVVVPPNVYVVQTRRGRAEPVTVGLGISFRYNPNTDAFLLVPAAVQTLIINARCISIERQGVLVQAYVQWIVADVRTAYRKLDFSDLTDPMRIVNVQLREQAEAAIKDKVATMHIDEILSDKQPIIEELTHRLRAVAEGGHGDDNNGLGLKIVTVQIKEAVVSSTRLWENLQKPFRAERERLARLAELDAQQQIARQELMNRQAKETAELEFRRLLAQLQATHEREAYDREQGEKARRLQVEQTAEQQAVVAKTATAKAIREAELERALHKYEVDGRQQSHELAAVQRTVELERARADQERQRTTAAIELANLTHQAECARNERDNVLFQARRAIENDLSDQHVKAQLISRLPEIATAMPQPEELRAVSISGDHSAATTPLVSFLASLLTLGDGLVKKAPASNGAETK